jgi:hypothetical protein
MTFKKFSKEEWFKLTQYEKDFHTLEFKESVENRIKYTVILTRIIALILIACLLFFGFIQIKAINNYGAIKEQYGKNAFCYLCGLESYRKCECQYISRIEGKNDQLLNDLKNLSLNLAEYNIQPCKTTAVQHGSYQDAGYSFILNKSEL